MNKPATKEPSMDEILSSIRQIIADDDASVAPSPVVRPVPQPSAATAQPAPSVPPPVEPLALSPAQMIPARPVPVPVRPPQPEPEPEAPAGTAFAALLTEFDEPETAPEDPMAALPEDEPELVDPEDVAFVQDPPVEAEPEPEPPPEVQAAEMPPPRPAAPVAQAAPMPDPMLSADMAEQLLEPATDAAVQGAMARLGAVATTGIGGMTIESMIRDLLRPMLKDWLDENLPALVERMVEKEIARISRGVK